MTEILAFGSLDSSRYLHPLDCCIPCTPLRLYSRKNTAVIPRKMIAFKLAAEVVTSLVVPTDYEPEQDYRGFGAVSYI